MHHQITLPEPEYKQVAEGGKRFIIAKHNPLYATADTLTINLQGHREQVEFTITHLETENVYGKYCVIGLTTEVTPFETTYN